MKILAILIILIAIMLPTAVYAQIENVQVEVYYISDASDATDTLGGGLEEGSVTYRIFIDLSEGCKLMKIYGDENHPIRIESTTGFFNNTLRGRSFGFELPNNNLKNNTMALDSWLTIGYATNKHMGIPKEVDPDTSIVGGIRNDGGSAKIPGGLLVNSNPGAGKSLTISDGLLQSSSPFPEFEDFGIVDVFTGLDTTIFGNSHNHGIFSSSNMRLQANPGLNGAGEDNKILIAQLTTTGELSFNLNVEVFVPDEEGGKILKFVSGDTLLDDLTIYSNWLSFPATCGCTDPDYAEFNKDVTCDDGSCATPVVFGCTDPSACNFNPDANTNLPELCCYDSKCALDLNIVCPGVVFGCTDPNAYNFKPGANRTSKIDTCCYVAGCRNPLYLEYNPLACFDDGSYCRFLIVTGCMNKDACNFNPFANRHEEDSCIYTGESCTNKSSLYSNSSQGLFIENAGNPDHVTESLMLYPNPVNNILSYVIEVQTESVVYCEIIDMNGKFIYAEFPHSINFPYAGSLDMSKHQPGTYMFRLHINDRIISKVLLKY